MHNQSQHYYIIRKKTCVKRGTKFKTLKNNVMVSYFFDGESPYLKEMGRKINGICKAHTFKFNNLLFLVSATL